MQVEGWRYYNHAMIPAIAPNETADMHPIENGDIWKNWGGGTPLPYWRGGQPIGIMVLRQTGGM